MNNEENKVEESVEETAAEEAKVEEASEESVEETAAEEAAEVETSTAPTRTYKGKVIVADNMRTVEGKEIHSVRLEDGTTEDVASEDEITTQS